MDLNLKEVKSFGTDEGVGNLLGVQAWMEPCDYASMGAFKGKLQALLEEANGQDWLGPKTIAVFPEHIGTWTCAIDAPGNTFKAETTSAALRPIAMANLGSFAGNFLRVRAKDRSTASLFTTRAHVMAEAYQSAFSALARDYGITIVAGSIYLPNPTVEHGKLSPQKGPIYNVSALFHRDGRIDPHLTKKLYPIADELAFCACADLEDLHAYDTPAGKLGTLICADSWFPETYKALHGKGAELLAVPSHLFPNGVWQDKWKGYSGHTAPADVDQSYAGKITEGEAWLKHALASRGPEAGFRYGINVFLRGPFWELGADGRTVMITPEGRKQGGYVHGSALHNLWLGNT